MNKQLVLYHNTLKLVVATVEQLLGGLIAVTTYSADPTLFNDPGLIVCQKNEIKPNTDLKGVHHDLMQCFIVREDITDLQVQDACPNSLGFALRNIVQRRGIVSGFRMSVIEKSMVLVNTMDTCEIFTLFVQNGGAVDVNIVSPIPSMPSTLKVLHNSLDIVPSTVMMNYVVGTKPFFFSAMDFDDVVGSMYPVLTAGKLVQMAALGGIPLSTTATFVVGSGAISSSISIPGKRATSEEYLQVLANPATASLQYKVSLLAGEIAQVEPMRNRREVIIQPSGSIRISVVDNITVADEGLLIPGGALIGFNVSTKVPLVIKAVDNADITIIQLGV